GLHGTTLVPERPSIRMAKSLPALVALAEALMGGPVFLCHRGELAATGEAGIAAGNRMSRVLRTSILDRAKTVVVSRREPLIKVRVAGIDRNRSLRQRCSYEP